MPVFLLWSLLPIALLAMQLHANIEFRSNEQRAMLFSSLGLIFSSLIFLWASLEMFQVDRRNDPALI